MTLPNIADVDTYGGELQNAGEVEDPTTDQDADAFNEMKADCAGMTHTAPRALFRFLGHATTPADPASGFIHDALWGSTAGVKPSAAKGGTGIYTCTWPTTVTDELGNDVDLNLRVAKAWVEVSGSTRYSAHARVTAANEVEVRVFIDGGAGADTLDDAAGLAIVVEVY